MGKVYIVTFFGTFFGAQLSLLWCFCFTVFKQTASINMHYFEVNNVSWKYPWKTFSLFSCRYNVSIAIFVQFSLGTSLYFCICAEKKRPAPNNLPCTKQTRLHPCGRKGVFMLIRWDSAILLIILDHNCICIKTYLDKFLWLYMAEAMSTRSTHDKLSNKTKESTLSTDTKCSITWANPWQKKQSNFTFCHQCVKFCVYASIFHQTPNWLLLKASMTL